MNRAFFFLALLPLASCSSLANQADQKAADSFYENAQDYYAGRDYARCMGQIEKGLALVPDHYGLNQLKGWVELQAARRDPEFFRRALETFESTLDLRSLSSQEYQTLLGLGMAHQGLYQYFRRILQESKDAVTNASLPPTDREQAGVKYVESLKLYRQHIDEAERWYRRIIEQGDLGVFAAHERLFLLETDRAADATSEAERKAQLRRAAEQAETYLKENSYRQEHYKVMLDLTGNLVQENLARPRLRELKDREQNFRAALANVFYDLGDHERARQQLDRVLELDPTSSADYYNRARCHAKLGNTDQARSDLEHFLRMTRKPFESPQVQEANRMLEELAKK